MSDDHQDPLIGNGSVELEETAPSATPSRKKSHYFRDGGERRIDLILAYTHNSKLEENDEAAVAARKREILCNNLREQGLELEEAAPMKDEYGTFDENENVEETRFIKVHAPFDVLCEAAEDCKIKMPTAKNDIEVKEWHQDVFPSIARCLSSCDPFVIKNPEINEPENYFVAPFDKERLSEFINHDKPDEFFSSTERSRLVVGILERTPFGEVGEDLEDENDDVDVGLTKLIHAAVLLDAYPMHDGPVLDNTEDDATCMRQKLQKDWACREKLFKYQPIHGIKAYFGEKVALYFAWLGLYTTFLVPAALIGLIVFIGGVLSTFDFEPVKDVCAKENKFKFYMCPLCDRLCSYWVLSTTCMYAKVSHFFDNEGTLFFAFIMSLWSTMYLEFWKRKQITLAHEWHSMDFEEEEERPRPEYTASIDTYDINPVTMKKEPRMTGRQRCARLSGAFGVVLFFVVLVVAAVASVIIFRAAFYAILVGLSDDRIRARSKMLVSGCAAVINLILINVLKIIYKKVAVMITDWENPRTQTDYEDSFTVKMFWFQFVNTYASIFYVAFFKSEFFSGWPGHYRRVSGGRFTACSVQGCFLELTIQLIIIMVGQQIIGSIMEILIPTLKKWWADRKDAKLQTTRKEMQWEDDFECQMQDKFSLFWQYQEIVLQYGFVTMFVAAFPLAPLFALLNNLAEIRVDAINCVRNNRRTIASRAEDIGAWYGILSTLTMFSVLVNAFVIAMTSDLIPRLTYKYTESPNQNLVGYMNYSLSSFDVNLFGNSSRPDESMKNLNFTEPVCRYSGYHEAGGARYSRDYFVILSARLAFVFLFQLVVFGLSWMIAYAIPDIPHSLNVKIRREEMLAQEATRNHREQKGCRRKRNPKGKKAPPCDDDHVHHSDDSRPNTADTVVA